MSIESKIFNYLLEIGCCKYCSIRYLRDRNVDFTDIDGHIKRNELVGSFIPELDCDPPQTKKSKSNPCVACLGLLQDFVMEEVVNGVVLSKVREYDSKVFTCSISIPAATLIREHTVRLDLLSNFPEYYEKDIEELPLNKTWKWIIKNKLSEKLGMTFENSDTCNFSINIIMDYSDNNEELSIVKQLTSDKSAKNGDLYSRKFVCNILASILPEEFRKVVKTSPDVPTTQVVCKQIECKHNSIYLAGRYCKFSRELSQSPWIIDGVKAMESSVEEIIFEQINGLFNIPTTNLKFSASGREDCDVRCLGKGRPFYLEILDPRKTIFSFEEFRNLEAKINASSLISVRDLQSVQRAELSKVKEGEQMKTKDYIALCLTNGVVTQEHIDKINNHGEAILEQKTPIRVLHRRPLAVRSKKVHKMEAKLIPGRSNVFGLHVVTEAGTYVKEFVHGDFGRTKPSIGDIIGAEVDIIALDVLAINLDWPKEIEATAT